MNAPALVLAPQLFASAQAKTAHGLVRGSERFQIVGVLDPACAGQDAGTVLDGHSRDIPIFATLADALARAQPRPDTMIVGVAVAGGRLPPPLRAYLREAAQAGLTLVNGLHEFLTDDPDLVAIAAQTGARLVDVRRTPDRSSLHFWTGAIAHVRAPRIAVLGTDCALGKRTTARLLVQAFRGAGVKAEMIFTGQTGWMQGGRYGFILDSTPNDFVSGELEHAVVTCDQTEQPDVIVIEGQSSLRNPSGPCGAELLVSAQSHTVVLQHAPARAHFKGHFDPHDPTAWRIPPIEDEIALIRCYGAQVVALALNGEGLTAEDLRWAQATLSARLALPVVLPLLTGVDDLVPMLRAHLANGSAARTP